MEPKNAAFFDTTDRLVPSSGSPLLRLIPVVFLLISCEKKLLELQTNAGGAISGTALMFSSDPGMASFSSGSLTQACATGQVSLHLLNDDGSYDPTEIASADVGAGGSFRLTGARAKGVSTDDPYLRYVIKALGCGSEYYRPLTEFSSQAVTGGSTLLAMAMNVDDGSKKALKDVTREEFKAAMAQLDALGKTTLLSLTNDVVANSTLTTLFQQITNLNPSKLKELPPTDLTLTVPTGTLVENTPYDYEADIVHWNGDYDAAYQWELDGNVVATSSNWTYTPSKNSQGSRTMVLKVGAQDGGGALDTSKPFRTETMTLAISNDFPPVAPSMVLVGANERNFRPGTVSIVTGGSNVNCASFSGLAINDSTFIPPVLASAYTITCTTAGTQTENFTLSAGDGAKTLALWAMDAAGNISSSASVVSLVLDETNPTATLAAPSTMKGGSTASLTFTASDATSGVQSAVLEYAEDGVTFGDAVDLSGETSPYTWAVPGSVNVTTAKLRLTVTDQAGNSTVQTTTALTIDSLAPTIAISSPAANTRAQTGVTVSGTCETGLTVALAGTGVASSQTTSCTAGSFSQSITFTAGDGVKNVSVSQTDAAGNIGTASRNFFKDTTPPTLSFSSPDAATQAKTGLIISGACETGSDVTISGTGVASSSTASCTASAFTANITFSAVDGTKTVQISQTDSAGNTATDSRDFERNNTAPSMTLTGPTANTRAQTGVTLTGNCDALYDVDVSGTGTTSAGAYTCSGGTFSIPVTFTGTDGTKSITVSQEDGIGNIVSVDRDFIKDTVAPTVAITTPAASTRAQTDLTITGTCETGLSVSVAGAGLSNPGSVTCTAGSFTFDVTFTATDETKNIEVSQTDQAGNVGTDDRDFVKDTTGPVAPTATLASATPSNNTAIQVAITCDADFDKVLYSTSATQPTPSDAAWETCATPKNLTVATGDGTKRFYVFTKDSLGNVSTASTTITMVLDQTPATVSLTSLTGGQLVKGNQNTSITWTASDTVALAANPISLEYSLNGGASWISIATAQANSGTYSWTMPGFNSTTARVRVKALDAAGNTGTGSSASDFTIDSTAPILSLDSLSGGQYVKGGASTNIRWTATDNNLGATPIAISYSTDGGTSWTALTAGVANSGTYAWTVPSVNSSQGKVRVTATDAVGQATVVASASNFVIDSATPSVTLTSLTGGQTILGGSTQNITWSATDANFGASPITLELSSDGGSTWTTIAANLANSGSRSWVADVADGTQYRVRVKATDVAGNSATSASSSNFAVSTQAPNLSQTTMPSPYYSNTATSVTFGGACDTGYNVSITGAETSSVTCPAGTWTWTTSTVGTDAVRDYTFSQTNAVFLTTTVTSRWVRDTAAPSISAIELNNGDSNTPTPTVSATITTSESSGLKIRLANAATGGGNCPAYADDSWQNQTSATVTYSHVLSSGDGLKKVCVWAKDLSGNVSTLSAAGGTAGQDMETITYSSGNPPQIAVFDVINDAGGNFQGTQLANQNDPLKVTWTVTDVEGLHNNPVYLDYTTNGTTWIPIEAGYGAQSGNPTSYSANYYGFSAPVNTFFRLRIRAKDSAGNTSSELYSKAFNTSPWSVVAGTKGRGEGGSAKSAQVLRGSWFQRSFAVHPKTGDVYYVDAGTGMFKVSAATGFVSKYLTHTSSWPSYSSSGTITTSSQINSSNDSILFDNDGYLYLITGSKDHNSSAKVIRIDLSTNTYIRYLDGGLNVGSSPSPSDVFIIPYGTSFAFDESNSLYFLSRCETTTWVTGTSTTRLMKVTKNPDGTAGGVSLVAGNCVYGAPVSGAAAVSQPFSDSTSSTNTLAVWNNGAAIFYKTYGKNAMKIVNGVTLSTSMTIASRADAAYNAADGKLYVSSGPMRAYTMNLSGAGGDVEDTSKQILGTGSGDGCNADGVSRSAACQAAHGVIAMPSGKIFFTEGLEDTNVLLRYLDDDDKIQTLIGSRAFFGEGLPASMARGTFAGIHYKKPSDPLATAYPPGLYFMENRGGVFGYFDATTGTTFNLWGNQAGTTSPMANGVSITSAVDLGPLLYSGRGDASAMTFDVSGRPWIRFNARLGTLDADRKLIYRVLGSPVHWQDCPPGGDPRLCWMSPYGGYFNFTLSGNSLFLMGIYYATTTPMEDRYPRLRLFDYDANNIIHVMGNVAPASAAEQLTEGSLENKPLPTNCQNNGAGCAIQYLPDQDRLYLADAAKLRYITNPRDPAHHTLVDVFTAPAGSVENFTVSPNRKYIMYLRSGRLYCHAIALVDESAICKNNPANHFNLGPPTGLDTITRGPNQFTWKDDSTLFISTYKGEIYQYILYH